MTLNTFVAGNPASVRASAETVRQTGIGVEDTASGWHRSRSRSEAFWEGGGGDAFRDKAARNGRDSDCLADLFQRMGQVATRLADELDTVRAWMEHAKQAAREGELTVLAHAIQPPAAFTDIPPTPPVGRVPAADSAAHAKAQADFQAAQALHAKQQAAYVEAQTIVNDARQAEKAAHDKLVADLNAISGDLGHLGQSGVWGEALTALTNPTAAALASVAMSLETHAANATRSTFESALAGGPSAVGGAWAAMTTAQKADLMDRFPTMIGSTDGLPAVVRSDANKRTLGAQREILVAKLNDIEQRIMRSTTRPNGPNELYVQQADQLRDALKGLDSVVEQAHKPDMFLLSLDADANGRGQVVLAHGNPDVSQNVMTTVPGTYADLGDAMDYVQSGDTVKNRAHQLSGQSVSSVTWVNYESPKSLLLAGNEGFANNASSDLARFQEGLRVSHEGGAASNNTVIGHSYGSTTVGYAARDHGGMATDNLVFIGSPGVGVEHAQGLGVPPERVWSGTAGLDPIDYVTPSLNPADYGSGLETDPITGFREFKDAHWFGLNPSDPTFGARELPTETWSGHGGYWSNPESVDGMARVVAGPHGQTDGNTS